MKKKLFLFTVLLLCVYLSGCRNPLMERALINLYHIGDRGPGGGIIFYRSKQGFKDTYSGKTHHFLEAAPDGWNGNTPPEDSFLPWAPNYADSPAYGDIKGAIGTAIGTGRKNTKAIIERINNYSGCPAAYVCNNYNFGGKSDWFLPSYDELKELYKQQIVVGIFIQSFYWSSSQSQSDSSEALQYNFFDGSQTLTPKNVSWWVRPIRSF